MKKIQNFILPGVFILFILFFGIFIYFGRENYQKLDKSTSTPKSEQNSDQVRKPDVMPATSSAIPNKIQSNYLLNPGFETDEPSWYSHENWKTQFKYNNKIVKTGKQSAFLELDSRTEGSQSSRVHGVVQDIKPGVFPEIISGNYYVENWQKGTTRQYLQMVVIVFGPDNIPRDIQGGGNYQIRYILAGTKVDPFEIKNAKYVYVNSADPVIGRWVHFERNLIDDFKKEWNDIPKSFTSIRVFFEARWDGRTETTPITGKVYYDDLYLGKKL
jgi:hypothetical protein